MLVRDSFAGSGTQYSTPGACRGRTQLSVQLSYSGTLTTATSLWCSNVDKPNLANDDDWVEKTDVVFTGAAGAPAKEEVPVSGANARWYRLKHVTASGAGTIASHVEHVLASTA